LISVRLTRVPDGGVPLKESRQLGLAELGLGEPFEDSGVSATWELSRMMGKVYGKMTCQASVRAACSRCLRDFSLPVHADFAVLFEPKPHGGHEKDEGEVFVEDDAGPTAVFFDGEELPLGEELRQELELAVPYRALCRKDCGGLCARCGANLNDGPCACPGGTETGPFSGLKKLLDP
jgi:uncharacterized protein